MRTPAVPAADCSDFFEKGVLFQPPSSGSDPTGVPERNQESIESANRVGVGSKLRVFSPGHSLPVGEEGENFPKGTLKPTGA